MLLLTFVLQYIASEDIFASSIEILDNVWIWISQKKLLKHQSFNGFSHHKIKSGSVICEYWLVKMWK